MEREIIVVGDRCLILPDTEEDKTDSGLYLPQGVKEKEKVQTGTVIKTGPGYPVPAPETLEREPWETPEMEGKYFPLQAKEGDYCVFLRNSAIELEHESKKYVIVPHSSILLILREKPVV